MNELRSFQFLLRWRTEDEVLSGAGETTCGNTRCTFHDSHNVEEARPSLKTLELPFSYEENGENKFALVKVVLCNKCCKRLMWKRNKEKERNSAQQDTSHPDDTGSAEETHQDASHDLMIEQGTSSRRSSRRDLSGHEEIHSHRRRNSRSRSPTKRHEEMKYRRRSP